jgi:hypothetical protein
MDINFSPKKVQHRENLKVNRTYKDGTIPKCMVLKTRMLFNLSEGEILARKNLVYEGKSPSSPKQNRKTKKEESVPTSKDSSVDIRGKIG